MIRNLTRRLERLDDQLTPPGEPLVTEVQFISATTREVVNTLSVTCGAALGSSGEDTQVSEGRLRRRRLYDGENK
jgi:hypothetical protein